MSRKLEYEWQLRMSRKSAGRTGQEMSEKEKSHLVS